MSYSTWHYYGYGICVDDIKVKSVDALKELLSFAPKLECEIQQWIEDCEITEPTTEDYLEWEDDFGYRGLAAILREVIAESEEIDFAACEDYNGVDYLIYEPRYPWGMSANDKTLTETEIQRILRTYVNILTDAVINIDYQSVENGG